MSYSLFKISERDHLGLILMTMLADAYKDKDRWVSLEEVARWGKFSQGYLEEIAAPLRQAGLIEARKGAGGGYRLVYDPRRITIEEILTALHGPLAIVPCLDPKAGCPLTSSCSSHHLWSFLQKEISETLQRTSLGDIVRRAPSSRVQSKDLSRMRAARQPTFVGDPSLRSG